MLPAVNPDCGRQNAVALPAQKSPVCLIISRANLARGEELVFDFLQPAPPSVSGGVVVVSRQSVECKLSADGDAYLHQYRTCSFEMVRLNAAEAMLATVW